MVAVSINSLNFSQKRKFSKIASELLLKFDLNQNINEVDASRKNPFFRKFFEYCNQKEIKTIGELAVADIVEAFFATLKK